MNAKLPLVVVEWNDAADYDGSVSLADVHAKHKVTIVTTVGWLMMQDSTGVTIASEFYDDEYRRVGFIPQEMLRSVTHYKLAKLKPKKVSSGGDTSASVVLKSDDKL